MLDVESTGLGSAVPATSALSRPPRVLLTVVRGPDGTKVRRWGCRSVAESLESLIDLTESGQDVEVAAHFGGSFDFRLCLEWLLETYRCRWKFVKQGALPISVEGRPFEVSRQPPASSCQPELGSDPAGSWLLEAGGSDNGCALVERGSEARLANLIRSREVVTLDVDDYEDDESAGLRSVDASRPGRFRLLDTIRLLPGRLREIGRAVGLGKGDFDHGYHAHRPYAGAPTRGLPTSHRLHAPQCYERLATYCERDTDVLAAGLAKITAFAEERGVRRRLTIASTSTAAIRRKLTDETVATAPRDVAVACRRACHGGRVEVFAREFRPTAARPHLYWYDIQSSYPRAMARGLPWRYVATRPSWDGEEDAVVEAVVTVPDDCEVPVLPLRALRTEEAGRVYFPSGTFRGTFHGAELAYAVKVGAAIVEHVELAYLFERSMVMAEFARSLWEERRVATGFLRYALKIWLNSAYGKLNEDEEKDEIVSRPAAYLCEKHRETPRRPNERCGCLEPLSRKLGLYSYKYRREPAFWAPWAAAAVLGWARVQLHEVFMMARACGGNLTYSDTDSIPTDVELPTEPGVLGALSLERTCSDALFVAPKLYAATCVNCDGKDEDGRPRAHPHDVVKAKGFSGLGRSDLEALVSCPRCGATGYRPGTAFGCPECRGGSLCRPGEGKRPYRYERSEGLTEALRRRGRADYRRIVVERTLRDVRPKRADGGARPWTVEELAERYS